MALALEQNARRSWRWLAKLPRAAAFYDPDEILRAIVELVQDAFWFSPRLRLAL